MIAAFRSQFLLLNRFRVWAIGSLVTVIFTVSATALLVVTSTPAADADGVLRPGTGNGIPLEVLSGPGGATAAVSWATLGFGFLLLLVPFTSIIGSEFTSGTFRSALLHHPNRWSLIGGKMAAMMAMAIALIALGFASGAVTATALAPSQGIDTTGWFGIDAMWETLADFGTTVAWSFGWAFIGTTLAVLVRSVPLALGLGIFWFGPFENVIGEELDIALRWFPGLLLQQVVSMSPDPASVSTGTAATTLAIYGVVATTVVAVFFRRLDVTS